MQIKIPNELYEVFMQFLDMSQAAFTEEDLQEMTEIEKQLFIFIEQLLGKDRVMRYKTKKELNDAKSAFAKTIGRET